MSRLYLTHIDNVSVKEYAEVKQRILAAASDPRGSTDTAFSAREIGIFLGYKDYCAVYTAVKRLGIPSVKTNTEKRRSSRVLTLDTVLYLVRQKGQHNILKAPVKVTNEKQSNVLDFVFNAKCDAMRLRKRG